MTSRRVKKLQLEERRAERDATSPNAWRKAKYHAMSAAGILGPQELAGYEELRVAVESARKSLEKQGINFKELPSQNPTRADYDLAKGIYYTHVCRGDIEGETLAELLESHDDRVAHFL
ncbi:MAG: hypothetical protein PHH00_00695 [Candidatus Nanoarchaeia archaeon]|nr:hypothetical protein [Candidatus Nanoarchaeia archaeon]